MVILNLLVRRLLCMGMFFINLGLIFLVFLESKKSDIDYYNTIINSSLEYKNSSDLDNLNLGTIDIKNILEKRQK